MPEVSRKPDEQESEEISDYLTRLWRPVHDHWSANPDPWYFQTAKIWDEKLNRPHIVPPEARAVVDHATDVFLTFTPTFHREPVGRSEDREKDANAVEAALLAVFMDAQMRERTIPFKDAAHYMNMYDYAVIEGPLLALHTRPQEPQEEDYDSAEEFKWAMIDYQNSKRFWNPLIIRAPHPATIMLDPNSKDPDESAKPLSILVKDVHKMISDARLRKKDGFPVDINDEVLKHLPDKRHEKVKGYEFWTNDWHWVTVEKGNEFLYVERNLMGFLPYTQGFGNYSYMSTKAATGEDESGLVELAQGLLDPLIDMFRMDAQGMSAKHNALVEQGFPRPGSRRDPSEAREQMANPDSILDGEASDWWWLQVPDLNRSVFQIGDEVKSQIAIGSYVRDVAGFRQQGVSTVGQQAILSQASNRKFDSPKVALDYMVTQVARNVLRLVDHNEEPLMAGGMTLDPKQIRHDYNVIGEFQVIDPVLQLQKRELGMDEVRMGLKSKRTYRQDDLRIPNETEEKDRLLDEYIEEDPFVKSAMASAAAEEMGIADIWEKRSAAMEAEEKGESPQISDAAGGGAPRALRQALTGDVQNPPRIDIPEGGV